jgi:protein KTI12
MRFEEPNPMTRWDSPLFVLDCNQDTTEGVWEKAPFDAIYEAIIRGKLTKAPDVVAPIRGTSTNYLSVLESTTQLVLSSFQGMASFGNLPDTGGLVQLSIAFPNQTSSSSIQLPLNLPVGRKAPTTAALQRLRRQFIKMHASGASASNEIGHLLGSEGGRDGASSARNNPSNKRDERKSREDPISTINTSAQQKSKSIEEDIARRFTAYLEETL